MNAKPIPCDRFLSWLPALLLAVNATLIFYSIHQHSVTIDEVGHIGSGVMSWETETYNAYRVNPPPPRMLATLPLMASDVQLPPDAAVEARDPNDRVEWQLGHLFAEMNRERYPELVHRARYVGILWSLLGGWVLFLWCRDLYGQKGACLALAVWCFEPNLMAHAQLVTPDFPSAVAALLAAYCLWLYMQRPEWSTAWLAGLSLGLALLTKFTLLVFLPVWFVLVLAVRYPQSRWVPKTPPTLQESRSVGIRRRLAHSVLVLFLVVLVINLAYGFHDTGRKLGRIPFVSQLLRGEPMEPPIYPELAMAGNRFAGTWAEDLIVPLPADYLRGIDVQKRSMEEKHKRQWCYLAGEWQEHGWWYYYIYALGVKVPLGFLALMVGGLLLATVRHRASAPWRDELVIALPGIAIFGFVSSRTDFNHHSRYVLAALPFLILGVAKFGYFLQRTHDGARGASKGTPPTLACAAGSPPAPSLACAAGSFLVCGLLLWGIVSAVRVYPHSLSYFNEVAGGPQNGSAHLIDSNIDWGQDLPALKRWMDDHPEARPMHAALFTIIDPTIYGLESMPLPPAGPGFAPTAQCGPRPGYYAISVNALRGKALIGIQVPAYALTYFQHFQPVARAGYSINIFYISPEEAERVRRQLGLPPLGQQ